MFYLSDTYNKYEAAADNNNVGLLKLLQHCKHSQTESFPFHLSQAACIFEYHNMTGTTAVCIC